jgi:hypothetical protein
MYDGAKIIVGLGIFVGVAAFPLWYSSASGQGRPQPDPVLPQDETACIESTEFMRASHMDLLDEWRNSVVRDGDREYMASDGNMYEKSLSRTCMSCHTNMSQFCDECHTYLGVEVTCWNCHVAPEGSK